MINPVNSKQAFVISSSGKMISDGKKLVEISNDSSVTSASLFTVNLIQIDHKNNETHKALKKIIDDKSITNYKTVFKYNNKPLTAFDKDGL